MRQIQLGSRSQVAMFDQGNHVSGVIFSSLDPSCITCDSHGNIHAVAVGFAVISAAHYDNSFEHHTFLQVVSGTIADHRYEFQLGTTGTYL